MAREYNTKNLKVVANGTAKLHICKAGETDATHYIDPKAGQVVGVNHVTGAVLEDDVQASDGAMEPALEEYRAALEQSMNTYIARQYYEDTALCSVYAKGSELTVVISAEKLNLRNFWSGQWLSTWKAEVASTEVKVEGLIKVRAHYFEDGNVQLQTSKTVKPVSLPKSAAAELAEAISSQISTEEKLLQEGLEDMYQGMTDETFKAMRRVMPVHRNKVSWNINEARLNANLTAGK
eukprot:FR741271.1.p1 GENE.FR741271.1~~FR741271.1.p1  ORF type:complete len:253 (+),score=36.83 FR741271.1:52-759(+)